MAEIVNPDAFELGVISHRFPQPTRNAHWLGGVSPFFLHSEAATGRREVVRGILHRGPRIEHTERGGTKWPNGTARLRLRQRGGAPLLVDSISRSDTYPYVDIREDDVSMGHEATVSKISDDQLFYLMSRGLGEDEAMAMIVRGFIEPIARELPMEYALELNRLIELQMEGAVG